MPQLPTVRRHLNRHAQQNKIKMENYLRKNNFKGTIVREETDFNNCGPTEIVLVPDVTMNDSSPYLQYDCVSLL